ncbi:MAG TPA: hypothetical protein PLP70_01435 [bacterium]|jgi:hypothetical protein|nr:hypothetical protein [bacterium]HQB26501.1 hypothetical protein [bacterium]
MKIMNLAVKQFLSYKLSSRRSGVIMIISFLIITGAFIIALSIATLVMIAINISRTQGDSVRAYFAADSGIERALAFDKSPEGTIDHQNCGPGEKQYLCCDELGECLFFDQVIQSHAEDGAVSGCFDCAYVEPEEVTQDGGQVYKIIYRGVSSDNSQLNLESIGSSHGVKRAIRLTIIRTSGCVPQCQNEEGEPYQCGYNGCNGFCGQCGDNQHCDNHYCVDDE